MHPDARVVRYDDTSTASLTFAELADQAARLAGALHGLGVRRDDLVATLCWKHPCSVATSRCRL
ncbi:hypothetical protein CBI38_33035 (plasmid) [Rhodococcus oxybenzonivorans]|uniref:AMP-dependent synthetase/ligase domain-containing protein n=1 Tax=Rhodococcus oxybenzonivorans TaxID=1990687 RepID=A0A2S2C5W6_9NOCA|nr:AMP-binding protein [Rhodococcus oxybenzonivorans]AWK76287.1 hypothetical protein CBI38_33035 [Rhodococcus oxybenzonivorans]